MGLFTRNAGSLLGVDIGTAAVKLVQLDGRKGQPPACASEALPPNAIAGGNVSDLDAVGEAIARAVKRANCNTKRAAVAVPAAAVATRTVSVDAALTDAEIEVEVALEARAQLPFGDEELALDFEVLQLSAADPARLDVAVTACRSSTVREREAALRRGGLRPVLVDVDSHCLLRLAARTATPGETVAVADIGAASVKLLTVRDDAVLFARAEPLPSTANGAGEALVLPLLERLLRLSSATAEAAVAGRLLLAGGGAAAADLTARAEQTLGLPVATLRPLSALGLEPATATPEDSPALATACGLALRAGTVLPGSSAVLAGA